MSPWVFLYHERISDNSWRHQKMHREPRNIKQIQNQITKRNPRNTIMIKYYNELYYPKFIKVPLGWYTNWNNFYKSYLQSAKIQWYGRKNVPLGKPVMYHVTLSEKLRYVAFENQRRPFFDLRDSEATIALKIKLTAKIQILTEF